MPPFVIARRRAVLGVLLLVEGGQPLRSGCSNVENSQRKFAGVIKGNSIGPFGWGGPGRVIPHSNAALVEALKPRWSDF